MEGGREGLSLPLQMSVDDRVKLTCSPHYTYIWGGESFQQMVDRQTTIDFAEPKTSHRMVTPSSSCMCTRMRKKCRVELAFLSSAWVPP